MRLNRTCRYRIPVTSGLLLALAAPSAHAQMNGTAPSWDPQAVLRTETFARPPQNVERIILAPRVDISFTNANADRSWFLRTSGPDRGDIKDYGKAHLWLGGVRSTRRPIVHAR
jgi:hypothetical protein